MALGHPRVLPSSSSRSFSVVILAPFLRHPREGEDLLTFIQRMFACANMTNVTPPADSRMRGNDESLSFVILASFPSSSSRSFSVVILAKARIY